MKTPTITFCFCLLILQWNSIFSQGSCAINIEPIITLCDTGKANLTVKGNPKNVQWLNQKKEIVSTSFSFSPSIEKESVFYVINKIPLGNNLIRNGNFELGDQFFSSDYTPSCVQGTMPQGSYCITENSGWFHPGWSNCTDKKNSGKMMVSDGAVKPNDNIWCQKVNVEQNKDYAFSAWITSLIALAPPVMQFYINNEALGPPFQTLNTPCEWQEFFQPWNSGTNTSAEICIVNQSTEGLGNDFAIDEISLQEACFSIDSTLVLITDSIVVDLGVDTSFCQGDEKKLFNLKKNTHRELSYNWSTGETSDTITITTPSSYSVTISTPEGCSASNSVNFTDIGMPTNTLPFDSSICFIAHPKAYLRSGNALKTVWSDGEKTDSSSIFPIHRPGTYSLTLLNGENCSLRHIIDIEDKCSYNLFIPSAFSPNGDGMNDFFGPKSFETYDYDFQIFNRWGKQVFQGKKVTELWDGTWQNEKAPAGIYVYYLKYAVIDWTTQRLTTQIKSGTVSLIR